MGYYWPEGMLLESEQNRYYLQNEETLCSAMRIGQILEGRALLCDYDHNLIVDLGCCRGVIPREEGALGIREQTVRDIAIISRVNKPVCFLITAIEHDENGALRPILSRRAAQLRCRREYIEALTPGEIIPARVTHLENFGCFVDIGCGLPSLISIDQISVSRISHPRDRFAVGESIYTVVKAVEPEGRVQLSHKELLGTWEENASLFLPGETVAGIIRSVEDYGVFVELTPNLAGLAEPCEGVRAGQHAGVYIKSILPEKMKVKLIIVDAFDAPYSPQPVQYFLTEGVLRRWRYSPPECPRIVETVFPE